MKRVTILALIISAVFSNASAQFTRYLVKFTDKGNNPNTLSNPLIFLSQPAIDRRTNYSIAIDSSDLPVTPLYISQVAAVPNVTILNSSKWLNQVSIQTTDANAIAAINNFSFVKKVIGIAARLINTKSAKSIEDEIAAPLLAPSSKILNVESNYLDYGANATKEIQLQHGEFLHNIGMRGETMRIALIDAGFFNYNIYPAFDSVNINEQVKDTWDFVAGNASVAEDYPHGMSCFSTIAANLPGQFIGMAPKSTFYLYRSEDVYSEYPIEEHNWVCAAERADSAGVNIISTSLGYATFDNPSLSHTYADLDGNTTMAAVGADMAAKKGILVFAGAGNSGADTWHYILTPADADSVVTVGAVNSIGVRGAFSSYGPTADGRIKPDVMSVGVSAVIETSAGTVGVSNGTSYACPKMAGLGTCLWQAFPEFNNMKIVEALKESGSNAATPNDSTGYGIPDMRLAFTKLLAAYATSHASVNNCTVNVNWSSKDAGGMKYEIEKKSGTDVEFTKAGELNAQQGTTLSAHSYQFNYPLNTTTNETITWRIKQIVDTTSTDLASAYIDTSSIAVNAGCGSPVRVDSINKITIAPNPVYNTITLVVESTKAIPTLTINIYDISGRLLLQQKEAKGIGKAVYSIPANRFIKGKYSLSVLDANTRIGTIQFLKL